jgi:hypothetical protein
MVPEVALKAARLPATRSAVALAALYAFVACGGGGEGSPSESAPAGQIATGSLVLAFPAKTAATRGGRDFLSPSAASVAIAVTGIARAVVGVHPPNSVRAIKKALAKRESPESHQGSEAYVDSQCKRVELF